MVARRGESSFRRAMKGAVEGGRGKSECKKRVYNCSNGDVEDAVVNEDSSHIAESKE